jgi:DNA-binding transcriptional ArsR family regulator
MTSKESEVTSDISRRLDQVVALLRIIARKDLDAVKKSVLSTSKKEQIYELCDGMSDAQELAKKVGVSGEYVRITLKELEDAGFILIKQKGGKRFPERVL